MRKHKYRYFYEGKMIEVGSIEFFTDGTYRVNDELVGGILLEVTGLLDRNGKEIYEGDVVTTPDANGEPVSDKAKVIYEQGCFYFDYGFKQTEIHWLFGHENEVEIIGNIYENPELLSPPQNEKGKKEV